MVLSSYAHNHTQSAFGTRFKEDAMIKSERLLHFRDGGALSNSSGTGDGNPIAQKESKTSPGQSTGAPYILVCMLLIGDTINLR